MTVISVCAMATLASSRLAETARAFTLDSKLFFDIASPLFSFAMETEKGYESPSSGSILVHAHKRKRGRKLLIRLAPRASSRPLFLRKRLLELGEIALELSPKADRWARLCRGGQYVQRLFGQFDSLRRVSRAEMGPGERAQVHRVRARGGLDRAGGIPHCLGRIPQLRHIAGGQPVSIVVEILRRCLWALLLCL